MRIATEIQRKKQEAHHSSPRASEHGAGIMRRQLGKRHKSSFRFFLLQGLDSGLPNALPQPQRPLSG
jgi:hypothetical protein